MDETNDLSISLGLDPSDLRSGLSDAERMLESSAQRIRSSLERIGNLGQQLAGLGATMTASLTLPIVGLATASIKAYGDIEALKKGLEAVAGSAELAEKQFKDMKEVAKLPGLGLQEAVKGTINLQAIGFSANKAKTTLLQFGNAVATVGKGRVEFERAIYGISQLANTPFPLGEDLNIVADVLPQVRTLLNDTFGTSRTEELRALGVTSQQLVDTIINGLGKLPRVSGGVKNAFENMRDSIQQSLGRIGEVINKNFDIASIVEKLSGFIDRIVSGFESLDPAIQKIILVFAGLTAVAGPLLVAVGGFMALLPTLTAGVTALGTVFTALLGPIGLVTVAIIGIVTAVVSNWDKIKPYLDETILRFKVLYNESSLFRNSIATIGFSFEVWGRIAFVTLKTIYQNFKTVGKGILDIWSGIGDQIEGIFTLDFDLFAKGTKKGALAIANTFGETLINNKNGFDELGSVIEKTEKKWSNFRFNLTEKINLGGGVSDELEKEVDKSLTAVVKKLKAKKVEIEEIKPIEFKSRGFLNGLGEEFKTLNDLMYAETIRIGEVLGTQLPTVIDEGALKAMQSAFIWEEALVKLKDNLNNIINDSTIEGINGIFSALGESLANGNNALKAIGQSILSTLGNFISKFGMELVKTALLSEVFGGLIIAIKNAFGNPYVLLALGAAAIAVGAAVSASARNTSSTASGGGGGISSANGSSGNNYSGSYMSGGGFGGGEIILRASGPDLIAVINRNVLEQDRLTAG